MTIKEITDNNDDGSHIGQDTSEKLGFYGVTPVDQPASASQAAVATSITTTKTTANIAATVADLITLVNQLRGDAVSLGLIKGSA